MTIIFDLGKVILDFDPRAITRRLSGTFKIPEKRIHEVIYGGELESLYDRGKMSSRDFYQDVVRSLGVDLSFREFRDMWTRIFTCNDGVCDVIQALKKRNRLLLLSNTNEMHFEYAVRTFDILNVFDDHILSYRVGERKPHPEIYLAALRTADCPADECTYIDDIEEYVLAARQAGMHGIVFRDAQQLQKELSAVGIRIGGP
jgi:HAD superfamily hydrolase (TIGR01509 family)